MSLIDKYLTEEFKLMPTRNTNKLESLLKKNKIKYKTTSKGIMVDSKDYKKVEELMTKNLLF